MSTPDDEYRALLEDRDEIISDLRAKLQAAEIEKTDILAQRDVYLSRAEAAEAKMDNLASLVRILVHSLRKVNPNSSNIIRAMDYLTRHRLTGSILRSDEPQPKEIPESGGHIESADCWCSPTVEEHPGGRLVIHNQTH